MRKIGIMQGRVLPERLDKLQIFPLSNWKEELIEIKEIGFNYVELLFDRDLILENLLSNAQNFGRLGIRNDCNNNELTAYSICIDYLSSISLMNPVTEGLFYYKIVDLINTIKNTSINVLIIPFFDTNSIESEKDLQFVLRWIERRKLDRIVSENNIILALELPLSAAQIRSAFLKHSLSNIAVCYDLGNAKSLGYSPEEEIIALKDLIVHVHIKDRKIDGPNIMLGKGDVNFTECLKSLRQIGYDGQLILETTYYNLPAVEAKNNLHFIQNIISDIYQ